MTLCGVLKDILLVGASIAIWATPISALQGFGYSIALIGLIYYKLGAAQIKAGVSDLQRTSAEFGNRHPILKKLLILGLVLFVMIIALVGVAPSVGYDPSEITTAIKEKSSKFHH